MFAPARPSRLKSLLATALFAASCGGDSSTPTPAEAELQNVVVAVSTTGDDPDTDGYTVTMGGRSLAVAPSGSGTFEDVAPGSYEVRLTGVAENCDVQGGAGRTVTVTESAGAQVAFAVACEADFGDGLTTIACPDLSPAAALAGPLDRVHLGRLPASLGAAPWARVAGAGGGDAIPAYVDPHEDGTADLLIPLHPTAPLDAGAVTVRVTDGERACEPFELTIEPLPAAPGEWTRLVDALDALLAAQADLFGVDLAELAETPIEQMEPHFLPIAVIQSVVDHPSNPNSLRAIAEGTAPFADGIDPALTNALLARTGLAEALEAAVGELPSAPSSSAGIIEPLACLTDPVSTGEGMSSCMNLAFSAALRLEGASNDVLGAIGGMIGVAGVIPTPQTKLAAAGAGAALWLYQLYREGMANLLPSEFHSIEVGLIPASFFEDQAGPGSWGPAYVVAKSKGWKLDKTVLSAILQAAGARDAYQAWLDRFLPADVVADVIGLVLNTLVQEAIDTTEGSDFVEIPSKDFGPADIASPAVSEARIVSGASLELDHTNYTPVGVGVTQFIVRTKADGALFGNQAIVTSPPISIEVKQLSLAFDPDDVYVAPGELRPLLLTVSKSWHPDMVELHPSVPLQGTANREYLGDNTHQVLYQAPADPDFDKQDLLTYRHTATTGARAHAEDEDARTAIATIRFGDLEISPRSACLSRGETLQFDATVEGPSDAPVGWEVDVGTIDDGGSYTAPETVPADGSATIRAFVQPHPDLDDEVTITIGGCTCFWSVTLGGSTVEGMPGDTLGFQEDGTPQLVWIEIDHLPVPNLFAPWDLGITRSEGLVPPGPGTYEGGVSGRIGVAGDEVIYETWYPGFPWTKPPDPPPVATAVLVIDEYVPGRALRGAVDGFVNVEAQPQDGQLVFTRTRVPFHATFAIEVPKGSGRFGRFKCTIGEGGG